MKYETMLEKEILRELASSLLAKYQKYMNANNIDINDKFNKIASTADNIYDLKELILMDCKTLDDLKPIKEKLLENKSFIERLTNYE
jgi:hypothetical protein